MSDRLKTAKFIHDNVWKHFIYVTDKKQYDVADQWTSHAKEVNEGVDFKDDCDGFALTCADLLIHNNVPKNKVRAIICKVETGEVHLVCGVDIDEEQNRTLILDNRYRIPYWWDDRTNYQWIKMMRFDKPGEWFNINK
jgi:predicted transglutaminase-like cysteine proteinase